MRVRPFPQGPWARWAAAALGTACLVTAGWWATASGGGADAVPIAPSDGARAAAVVAPPTGAGGPTSAPAFAAPPARSGAPPVTLRLPSAPAVPVEPVGVAADGSMQVPDDPGRVGWWVAGAAPADAAGTTVLVGHLDSASRGIGVFAALLTMPAETEISLLDSGGVTTTYRVSERQQLAKADLSSTLFDRDGPRRLLLITCGGAFDPRTHHYDDNVVVTAVPVQR